MRVPSCCRRNVNVNVVAVWGCGYLIGQAKRGFCLLLKPKPRDPKTAETFQDFFQGFSSSGALFSCAYSLYSFLFSLLLVSLSSFFFLCSWCICWTVDLVNSCTVGEIDMQWCHWILVLVVRFGCPCQVSIDFKIILYNPRQVLDRPLTFSFDLSGLDKSISPSSFSWVFHVLIDALSMFSFPTARLYRNLFSTCCLSVNQPSSSICACNWTNKPILIFLSTKYQFK